MPTTKNNFLALDVGERRVGVAVANAVAKLANPLTVLNFDDAIWEEISGLIEKEAIGTIIVGLPRALNGNDTEQTRFTRNFAAELREKTDALVVMQDEALTSRQAEAELRARGKVFAKGDIDSLAATYILEDYLSGLASIDSVRKNS